MESGRSSPANHGLREREVAIGLVFRLGCVVAGD